MTLIEDIRRPVSDSFLVFQRKLEEMMRTDNPLLHEVFNLIQARRGKQLRPLIVLLSAELCHGVTDKTTSVAAALEMMHTASLVHDDVVDASPMRRGLPSVQTQWNNKIAVLVGDYILSRVIDSIANLRSLPILNIISEMSSELTSGELLQLHYNDSLWIDENRYFDIIRQKTASLFSACSEAGAVSSGGSLKQVSALKRFGLEFGYCFQMQDDLLDYSDSEEVGKPTMSDIQDGKVTLPLIAAHKRATANDKKEIDLLIRILISEKDELKERQLFELENELKTFVLRYDGIGYTQQQMRKHYNIASETLDDTFKHESAARTALHKLLDYTMYRNY